MGTLHKFLASATLDPAVTKEAARVQFSSSYSESVGGFSLAGIWTNLGRMLDFQVTAPATNAKAPATTEIHDYSGGRAAKTVAWMAKYFNATVIVETPHAPTSAADATPSPGATPDVSGPPDVVVVLGTDHANAFNAPEAATQKQPTYQPTARPSVTPRPTPSTEPSPTAEPTTIPTPRPPICGPAPLPPCHKPAPSPSPSPSGHTAPSPSPSPAPNPAPNPSP
jgi:hypothetical protein